MRLEIFVGIISTVFVSSVFLILFFISIQSPTDSLIESREFIPTEIKFTSSPNHSECEHNALMHLWLYDKNDNQIVIRGCSPSEITQILLEHNFDHSINGEIIDHIYEKLESYHGKEYLENFK